MDEGLKRRLVGATVLVSLIVIFVPMLLDQEPAEDPGVERVGIPPRPAKLPPPRLLPEDDEMIALPPAVVPEPLPPAAVADRTESVSPAARPAAADRPVPENRPALSSWVIQAGSFSNRNNAENLVRQLRGKGFSAFVQSARVQGRNLSRVLVGPEVDRRLAEQLLVRLNRELKSHNLTGKLRIYSGPGSSGSG